MQVISDSSASTFASYFIGIRRLSLCLTHSLHPLQQSVTTNEGSLSQHISTFPIRAFIPIDTGVLTSACLFTALMHFRQSQLSLKSSLPDILSLYCFKRIYLCCRRNIALCANIACRCAQTLYKCLAHRCARPEVDRHCHANVL